MRFSNHTANFVSSLLMQDRREFIQLGGIGLLSLFANKGVGSILPEIPQKRKVSGFKSWSKIGSDFMLNPSRTFLNNGTMGPSPKVVVNRMMERIKQVNQDGIYGGGDAECVQSIARLMKVLPEEIAMTHNVTEGVNIAAWGLPLKEGDEVILSDQEHVGNAAPWLNLARIKGIVVKVIPFGRDADETFQIVKSHVTAKTRVIAIPHIPCTTGQIAPVKEICAFAKSKSIYTVLDGAHGTGMLNLDLHDIGCDVYVSCCHKWLLGPKGTGYIYVRKDFLNELESVFSGAYSAGDWALTETESSFEGLVNTAHKYYFGTHNSALYFGVQEAVKYQESLGQDAIENRIRGLNDMLYQALEKMPNISILTPKESISRCAVLSFKFSNYDNRKFYDECHKEQITIRFVAESKLDCIRVSTHLYNSEKDIEKLLAMVSTRV